MVAQGASATRPNRFLGALGKEAVKPRKGDRRGIEVGISHESHEIPRMEPEGFLSTDFTDFHRWGGGSKQ